MKSKSIYRSCQYHVIAGLFGKDPNYDLITPNGIIRHFVAFIEPEEVRKLVIPVGQKGLKLTDSTRWQSKEGQIF